MGGSGFIESSGNVFLDLGLPDAEELFAESGLAIEIVRILEERGVDTDAVPQVIGVAERIASDLLSYRLDGLSVRELIDMLITLGQDVELVIRPTTHEWGRGGIFVTRCTTAKEPDDESRWRYPMTFTGLKASGAGSERRETFLGAWPMGGRVTRHDGISWP